MGNIEKNWGGWDLEEAAKEQETLDKAGSGEFLKLKMGRNKVRFLPPLVNAQGQVLLPVPGVRSPFVVINQHFIKVPGSSGSAVFNCARKMGGGVCRACQMAERLRGSGNRADYQAAGEMLPKVRVIANVIDRSDEDAGPQLIGFGKTVHEPLIALREDVDSGGDFTDPTEEGYDIIIEKEGEGMNTEYTVRPDRKSSALGRMEWIEEQHELMRFLNVPSQDEVEAQLSGGGRGGGGGGRQREALPARGGADVTGPARGRNAAPAPAVVGAPRRGRGVRGMMDETEEK
jgi:hypothetical protein